MKIMMGALLALYCGVVAGAECTSPPAVVWTDASGCLCNSLVQHATESQTSSTGATDPRYHSGYRLACVYVGE